MCVITGAILHGLQANQRYFPGAQRLALPAGDLDRLDPAGWDEITPFCRNQLEATKAAQKRADSHQRSLSLSKGRVHAVLGGISFDVLPTDIYKFLIISFIDILNWNNNG